MSETEQTVRLPDMTHLVVSSSPHIHDKDDVRAIMLKVICALAPACLASIYIFGIRALMVLLVCAASCVAFEALFTRMQGRPLRVNDCSGLLTGILLGMNLPVTAPLWLCVVGSLAAIGLGKMAYGGLGYNPFNPALVGRVALLIAFPSAMTTWALPACNPLKWLGADAATGATPLALLESSEAEAAAMPSFSALFWGGTGGSLGETCAAALLVGGIALVFLNVIRWQIPVCLLGTVALCTGIGHLVHPEQVASPLLHLFSGGLFLGAFFMATDMVTTPLSRKGAVVFGIGCGLFTSAIRMWGNYPEGMSFSILIMNSLTPLIDRFTARRPFGVRDARKEVKA